MILSISMNLVFFSTYMDNIIGNIFALFLLSISAAETALGLSLIIKYFSQYGYEHLY